MERISVAHVVAKIDDRFQVMLNDQLADALALVGEHAWKRLKSQLCAAVE
jgi:hypothetical protein